MSKLFSKFCPFKYFHLVQGEIPNQFSAKKANKGILKEFQKFKLLKEYVTSGVGSPNFGNLQFSSMCYSSQPERAELREVEEGLWMVLGYRENQYNIFYTDEKREKGKALAEKFEKKYSIEEKVETKGQVFLLFLEHGSYYLKKYDISKFSKIDLGLNYGQDFIPIYKDLVSKIENEKTGLIILNGQPGGGKTSLIRHLINDLSNQKILFIPNNYLSALSDPNFLPFISEEQISLIIAEDAEDALRSRDESNPHASSLLNITDGLLGDILQIKILCTMNTSMDNIDPAFKRRGRLKFTFSFEPLKPADADKLLISLGFEPQQKSMSLAEIYNFGTDNGVKPKEIRKVGF